MKIGLLTWFFAGNYGAIAHTYALRETLLELGCECEFINFVPKNSFSVLFHSNANCGDARRHPVLLFRCLLRCLRFIKSTRRNTHGRKVKNGFDVDKLQYDLVVLGSDAIFNTHHPLFNPIYYGVGIKETPLMTYAPSCEFMSVDELLDDSYCESIKKTVGLSARDRLTKIIIDKSTGRKAQLVLDPTLLYEFRKHTNSLLKGKYILIYTFSPWDEYSISIRDYARKNHRKIVSVGRFCRWADISFDAASFDQWLTLFEHTDLVLTDSFHGTIFAIKNTKKLVVLSRSDKANKIRDFLDTCGLYSFKFYNGENLETYLETNIIPYRMVNDRIGKAREESVNYLKKNIFDIRN